MVIPLSEVWGGMKQGWWINLKNKFFTISFSRYLVLSYTLVILKLYFGYINYSNLDSDILNTNKPKIVIIDPNK